MSMKITRRRAVVAAAAIGTFAIARRARAEDTLKIGVVSPQTGPVAEPGRIQLNSLRIAADQVNDAGGILGRKVELIVEDDQSSNPGAVLAFSRLAEHADIVAFIGSIRSTQMKAMAPDMLKVAKPVMFGGTDPSLTHIGNPWLFRCRPNDSFSARVMANFCLNSLKLGKIALVHSTDTFGTGGEKQLLANLEKAGVTPVLDQGYTNNQPDFTPVVLAVKSSGAEVLTSYFTNEPDNAVFARQLRQLGVRIPWVGSQSITSPVTRGLAKNALYGTFGISDFVEDSNPTAKALGDAYRARFNASPDSGWTFDAMHILARAIADAGSTEPGKIREAILAIRKFPGAEGEYNFDQNGDGLHGYNIVVNTEGKLDFKEHIEFTD
jgi:branched-chain amino acid transport system substrate-binding protein